MACEIDWLAFLVAMALVELTPGPNMGWLTAQSAQMGRKVGFMAVAGITLGLCVQLVAAALDRARGLAGHRQAWPQTWSPLPARSSSLRPPPPRLAPL